jgi:CheY-like chemotaxis protein
MFRNLHNLFSVSAKSKNLEFSISVEHDVPNELISDALRIQQILSNLLGNAIKFTEHGKIELRIKQIENRAEETVLRFSVEDTGIGIKAEHQENLFKPFHQADNSITRRFGGTGLGLTISRDLLRLMDSDFHIDSVEGKGTTIYFDLLLKIPSTKMSKQSVSVLSNQQGTLQERLSEISKSLTGTKILLAEDNLLNQEIVSGFLKMSGIEVDIADNGIIALELLKLNLYDAILMDVHMPEMDGLQATKAIREQSKYADLPIIALTAGITTEEQEKCLAAGMNNLVEKPINPEVLLQTLSRCMRF